MLRIFGLLLFGLTIVSATRAEANISRSGGVRFLENLSWSEVRDMAKRERKYLFIDCYASWCAPCRTMDNETYPDERVGTFINQYFLSIKIQCDTSKGDGVNVKARYADAHQIVNEYGINAYPTYLFFSPDGELVHKGIGYYAPEEFIGLARSAMKPALQYYTLIKEYRAGELSYNKMAYLAELANQNGDEKLFVSLIRDYIRGYINNMPDSGFYVKHRLDSVLRYVSQLRTDDRIVLWLIQHSRQADSIYRRKGFSERVVDQVIYQDKIMPVIERAKETGEVPDWHQLSKDIVGEFGDMHMDAVLHGKIDWYQYRGDWEQFCNALLDRLDNWKEMKDVKNSDNRELINTYAYGVFLRSKDVNKLERALSWITLVVDVVEDSTKHASNFMDTKANLLYRLGRGEEAISLENKAAMINPFDNRTKVALEAMKEGKPTW
ncbi:MAG TPA: DUF255 domain-containing protein [Puia sp.]|uniref:thioredoxin family protein n=1 Tax=Puia sp. TaxID=2045100 RepID=UPI002B544317|nr:DUF255 domain-containing protein [Puia sp.]HVU95483.1 DUF255 domain-containing protein [Puia sp.]